MASIASLARSNPSVTNGVERRLGIVSVLCARHSTEWNGNGYFFLTCTVYVCMNIHVYIMCKQGGLLCSPPIQRSSIVCILAI